MINDKIKGFFYGADYNPDQWSEETWIEDIRQMKIHGVNVVTLPVFSWAKLQPSENEFDFSWLDKIVNLLYENGIYVNMATPTAAQPAWMDKKYPEITRTDINGHKRKHGGRVNFCPNSPEYRRLSKSIASKMAEHYKDNPAIVLWHVNNEYGAYCYCENCRQAFIKWLKNKYINLENLNKCWYTSFWGHTIYDFDEIEVPSALTEILPGALAGRDGTYFQPIAIDYKRFMSDSLLECFKGEALEIRKYHKDTPITTNIWSVSHELDLFRWGEQCDIASWDSYPSNKDHPSLIAFKHDVIRGLKKGKPFLLMEQTPSQQNWQPYNAQKRPGVMRLLSYQCIAHGADGIMFFQWRQSLGACEKYHAAMVPHVGHENTRIGIELTQLGMELRSLQDKIIDSKTESEIAFIMDWPNWWGVEYSSGPSVDLTYIDRIMKYYRALYDLHISVDIVEPTADLSKYKIVIAPVLYMVSDESIANIEKFVSDGGTFITTFFSGIVDENDIVRSGGYPGAFRKLLGIWVEEVDALYPEMKNGIKTGKQMDTSEKSYECKLICEVLHSENAAVLGTFTEDYYKGFPAITENAYGKGKAVYVASEPEDDLIKVLLEKYCKEKNIQPIIKTNADVEITRRVKDNNEYIFILNHSSCVQKISLQEKTYINLLNGDILKNEIEIESKEVLILNDSIVNS
ncbi:beta-galactosidase [Clostridium sp. JN-9]|uniref:beta-galactosidase n=1 Tax=Clostridium sp. JN-9 TaxID=2507159 RepID=UPI000FFE0C1D|nr:beta-galactosidase [Clostridium sp. JN-9]QAT39929.1 beta-galactosidase [Clostridium sp. JN-9]